MTVPETHVFVINLARARERRARMEERLSRCNLPVTFFEAVDGNSLSRTDIDRIADPEALERHYDRMLSRGEVACAASHRGVYAEIVERRLPRSVILEDDTVPSEDFQRVLEEMAEIRISNYVTKIDSSASEDTASALRHRVRLGHGYSVRKPVFPQWDARGYVIDEKAASNLLRAFPRISRLADDWGSMRKYVRMRYLVPGIIGDDPDAPSQLESERSGKSTGPRREAPFLEKAVSHAGFFIEKYARTLFS